MGPFIEPVEDLTPIRDPFEVFTFSPHVKSTIESSAAKWNLDKGALSAMVFIESSGDIYAQNPSGATGLLQLKPETFYKHFPYGDIYNPEQNIDAAIMEFQKKHFPHFRGKLWY